MNNTNLIREALLGMEGGNFQKLADAILYWEGFRNINSIGMQDTTFKTVKGTPDSFHINDDGKFVFVEATSHNDNKPGALYNKLKSDIEKCLDEEKTGVSISDIERIILMINKNPTLDDHNALDALSQSNGVKIEIYHQDKIANGLLYDYPHLSDEYLGIKLSTGQFLPPNKFIERHGKNRFSTPLDKEFILRENQIEQGIELLNKSDFLIINGPSGVGKTHFALAIVNKFTEDNSDYTPYCVFYNGTDLEVDITLHMYKGGNYLIFIDDANKLDDRIDYIIERCINKKDGQTVKVIATVRDYAKHLIIQKAERYFEYQSLTINELGNEEISRLVKEQYGINNPVYIDRIVEISNGNPRIAIMTSKLELEEKINTLESVAQVYELYFNDNGEVGNVLSDAHVLASAAAIAFFRKIDIANQEYIEIICQAFDLNEETFRDCIETLHEAEIINIHEKEIVEIADQILSTYILFNATINRPLLDLNKFIIRLLPNFSSRFIEYINPLLKVYGFELINEHYSSIANEVFDSEEAHNNKKLKDHLVEVFWFTIPSKTLGYIHEKIKALDFSIIPEYKYHEDAPEKMAERTLKLIYQFRLMGGEEFDNSLELLIFLISKWDKISIQTIDSIASNYSISHSDYRHDYYIQNKLIDCLLDNFENGCREDLSRLFISITESYLKPEQEDHVWDKKGFVTFRRYSLPDNDSVNNLRKKLFKGLAKLYEKISYKKAIQGLILKLIKPSMMEANKTHLLSLIDLSNQTILSTGDTPLSIEYFVMYELIEQLEKQSIDIPKKWDEVFNDRQNRLFKLIDNHRYFEQQRSMSDDEYREFRVAEFNSYIDGISKDQFFDVIRIINELLSNDLVADKWGIGKSLQYMLDSAESSSLFSKYEVVQDLIVNDDTYKLDSVYLIDNSGFSSCQSLIDFLLLSNITRKKELLTLAYLSCTEEEFNNDIIAQFLVHIKESEYNEIFNLYYLPRLMKFENYQTGFINSVIDILLIKAEEDERIANLFSLLFNHFSDIHKLAFKEDMVTKENISRAFLFSIKVEQNVDYDGSTLKLLVQEDNQYLYDVFDVFFEKEPSLSSMSDFPDIGFLWSLENPVEVVFRFAEYLFNKKEYYAYYDESVLSTLCTKELWQKNTYDFQTKIVAYLDFIAIKEGIGNDFLKFLVANTKNLHSELFADFSLKLLSNNSDIEILKCLVRILDPSHWSQSKIPYIVKQIDLLSAVKSNLKGIDFLQHRILLDETISQRKKEIVHEKKHELIRFD